MKKSTRNSESKSNEPGYNDPFGPPEEVVRVRCLHCDETYESSRIEWNVRDGLWVCKNYESCGGAGYGIDIFDAWQFEATK